MADQLAELIKRIEQLEARERETDMEIRAALLRIVAHIERKHKIGQYNQKVFVVSEVNHANQAP